VARDAKAAGITGDPVSVEVVMGDVCYWLHNDESDTEVARTFASELGQVTRAQTYALATMAVRYLCPPERGKLDDYLSASSNPTLHAAAPRY
jgi:hypothetical protein